MKDINLSFSFANDCAWRAVYLTLNGKQIAHLGIDPYDGVKPQVFGSIGCSTFRVLIPTLRFKHPSSPLRSKMYVAMNTFWHKVDGRENKS